MSTHSTLFSPATVGRLALPQRFVMAPMTRNRALPSLAPGPQAALYYAQRASAGLVITEATQVSDSAAGYVFTPGIYSDEQIAGWRHVTDAVHAAGGAIVVQLWHTGRISHPTMRPDGSTPVSASAIAAEGEVITYEGPKPFPVPRALETGEIADIVADFATAARNAIAAGFDGVEIHAANGYLVDQFLRDGSNRRTDAYGGSLENRARFLLEIVDATSAAIGAERVGVRISPANPFNSMSDSDPEGLTRYVASQLAGRGVMYLHVVEGPASDDPAAPRPLTAIARAAFPGVLIANSGYTVDDAERVLARGDANLVAFGVPFLATPDFVERTRVGAPLNTPDRGTFYGGDARGYVDYPFRDGSVRLSLDEVIGVGAGA
ncbi:alkene reductase [Luteitalea sp. TBR-22]|uniref:alkene reductase n=1 Tax=Luteitalea sp. TBR-22 TaxID=2802971 RepID=UPI001AF40F4E|nr:alkene reductase [Luteitalea sp. TBR-22]BCS31970.1 alkene reductase [Luteitalea sp. TBR-22]